MHLPTFKSNTKFLRHMKCFYEAVSKAGYLRITSRYRVPVLTATGLSVSGYIAHYPHLTYEELEEEKYHHDILNNILFNTLDEAARTRAADAGLLPHAERVLDHNNRQIGYQNNYFHNFMRNLWILFDQPKKFCTEDGEYNQLFDQTLVDIHRLYL